MTVFSLPDAFPLHFPLTPPSTAPSELSPAPDSVPALTGYRFRVVYKRLTTTLCSQTPTDPRHTPNRPKYHTDHTQRTEVRTGTERALGIRLEEPGNFGMEDCFWVWDWGSTVQGGISVLLSLV